MICVLVGICCAALLTLSHYSNLFALKLETQTELLRNNKSALNYYLASIEQLNNKEKNTDIFDNGIVSTGSIKDWGLYKILEVTSTFKKDTIQQNVLVGKKRSDKPALYLVDNDKPLQMVGKAKIIGDVLIPKRGIKRGYITNQSFSSFTFLEGNKLRSKNKLPLLKNDFYFPEQLGDTLFMAAFKPNETIHESFKNESKYIHISANKLQNRHITGNIILKAKDSIYIHKNCELQDVLIDAPIVVFEKGFTGTVQVKSSRKIILEEGVILKYPSSLLVEGNGLDESEIYLSEKSKVLGNIILLGEQIKNNGANSIHVLNDAQVIGEIYSTGSVDLKGRLMGSLYTDNFYLKTKASSYENHIEDGIIDSRSIPENFLGDLIDNPKNKNYGIIKTL